MEFQKGLNVIIGTNNSGKSGLLYAIRLLHEPVLSVDDFNKNNLLKYTEQYLNDAPPRIEIEIEYVVRHLISESDTEDESIIRLLPFLGMDKLSEVASKDDDENFLYDITAVIKAVCTLDSKVLGLIIMVPAILKRQKKKLQRFLTFGLSALNGQAMQSVRKLVGRSTPLLRIKAIRLQ